MIEAERKAERERNVAVDRVPLPIDAELLLQWAIGRSGNLTWAVDRGAGWSAGPRPKS